MTEELRLPFPLCSEDFKWEKRISQGAFSNVFVVKHQASGGDFPYVCKVIRKRDVAEREQIGRVLYERKLTMSTLRENPHPYIVRHFGAFHDENCIYFVSEFVSGGDSRHLETSRLFENFRKTEINQLDVSSSIQNNILRFYIKVSYLIIV